MAGRVPVYGNVGCVTTRETVKLAQQAEAEGVDYLVVITPYYLKPTADELVDHYVEVCRAVRVPVLAYNIPERTGVELTPGIVGAHRRGVRELRGAEGLERQARSASASSWPSRRNTRSPSSSAAIT